MKSVFLWAKVPLREGGVTVSRQISNLESQNACIRTHLAQATLQTLRRARWRRQDRLPVHKREDKDTLHISYPGCAKAQPPQVGDVAQPGLRPRRSLWAAPRVSTVWWGKPHATPKGGAPSPNTGYQPGHFTAASRHRQVWTFQNRTCLISAIHILWNRVNHVKQVSTSLVHPLPGLNLVHHINRLKSSLA
jgi:hypothetical protein